MKRVFTIILMVCVLLTLCACGPSEEDVKDAIIKETWLGYHEFESGRKEYIVNFTNSNWATIDTYHTNSGFSYTWEGTYEIRNNQIIVSDDLNTRDFFIDYKYSKGEISLTLNDGDKSVPLSVVPDDYA